ncbi:MAG TPA: hypothetical protein VG603_02250, partial [Chitinophagales bacterium]|nr:hypothetical protein [Chitinophagales bacterium]
MSLFLHAYPNAELHNSTLPYITSVDSLIPNTTSKAIDSTLNSADTSKPAGPQSTITQFGGDSLHVDSLAVTDSMMVTNDTIHKVDSVKLAEDEEIKDPINYKAEDSIVYDMGTKKMYLYNTADVKYQQILLDANLVKFDWTTFTLTSEGTKDSTGELTGNPVFTEDGKEYKAKRLAYNFKTKKGKVYEVVTKEGEAYIHSEEVKKNEYDEWYGKGSEYTTCDLDHPHFYFKAKKVKIVPNKVMVTGPANLWI